ncbi:hypothetical protein MTR67_017211 [Solanum verrucosum]|uniref:Uncharacterized protein n=1 Tax=Solanum verrucosum TaxID=315347 RepID=A0AAF0TL98_SOLVR|nr:hypothetical protein MTR67_017211 [Solanum verrucosum]
MEGVLKTKSDQSMM